MTLKIKNICITAMGIALFVVLSLCLQVPVFENYYLCLGYVVLTVFCYYYGPLIGATVGASGVILYCLLTNGLRGMPGWALGNLVIGIGVGLICKFTRNMKQRSFRYFLIGISVVICVAIAMLGVKSVTECILYAQPMLLRMTKNMYAFISDSQAQADVIYHTYHSTKGREFDNVIIFMTSKFLYFMLMFGILIQ